MRSCVARHNIGRWKTGHRNSQHLSQMVSQISHADDFDRKFLEKRCGLSASLYGNLRTRLRTRPPVSFCHTERLSLNLAVPSMATSPLFPIARFQKLGPFQSEERVLIVEISDNMVSCTRQNSKHDV